MKTRIGTLAVLAAVLACAPAFAAPTKVNVRVEGAKKTIFEGAVTTDAHPVTGDNTGPHKCDGTNGGANPTPGPTVTGALDNASTKAGFSWDGSFDPSFEDFLVSRIGPDTQTSSKFWGNAVNGQPLQVGGCQFQVKRGQEVLWAYDMFGKKHILLLRGFRKVRAGKRYAVKVKDGQNGKPVAGAKVGGKTTNKKGIARLRFKKPGVKRLKARRSDSVRSNQLRVKVLPRKHGGAGGRRSERQPRGHWPPRRSPPRRRRPSRRGSSSSSPS